MKKKIPEFKSEDAQRKFWGKADSAEYVDWKSAKRSKFARLKLSLKTISLRLPVTMIEDLKVLAKSPGCSVSVIAEGFSCRADRSRAPTRIALG
jgi:hypothetical protein